MKMMKVGDAVVIKHGEHRGCNGRIKEVLRADPEKGLLAGYMVEIHSGRTWVNVARQDVQRTVWRF